MKFEAKTKRIKFIRENAIQTDFYAFNPASRDIIGQAVPSVSPGTAAIYLNNGVFLFRSAASKGWCGNYNANDFM